VKYNYIKSENLEEILKDVYNIHIDKYEIIIDIIYKLFNSKYKIYK